MSLELSDYVLSAECYTVRLMLALLGLAYTRTAVDLYPGGAEAPVLVDGDAELRDPGLILTYLTRTYAPAGGWLPGDRIETITPWLAFAAFEQAPLRQARLVAMLGQPGNLDELNAKGRLALRRLDDHLTQQRIDGHDWLSGSTPTIADIAVFPSALLSHDSGLGHEDFPAINLWQRRVRSLPGFVGMPGIPDYF